MSDYRGLEGSMATWVESSCLKDCVAKAKETLMSDPEIKSVEITWVNADGGAMPRVFMEKFPPVKTTVDRQE